MEVALKENGPARVMASCHTPVAPGYYIYPSTEKIKRLRRNILELVLSEYPPEKLQSGAGHASDGVSEALWLHTESSEVRYPRISETSMRMTGAIPTSGLTCQNALTATGA